MAKAVRGAVKAGPATTALATVSFEHFKDTKNKNRFNEIVTPGQRGTIGSLYLMKPFFEKSKELTVNVVPAASDAVSVLHEAGSLVLVFDYEKETKGTFRYAETGDKQSQVVQSLYLNKDIFTGEAPARVQLEITG